MTLKGFKEIVERLYYYANAGAYPKEMDALPEDEQDTFFKGYETALHDFFAQLNMDKVPEHQQTAFLKGYCKGMHEVMQNLNELRLLLLTDQLVRGTHQSSEQRLIGHQAH